MNDVAAKFLIQTSRLQNDRAAECAVLREMLAELTALVSGKDAAACRAEIDARIRERQEEYLIKFEDVNPSVAAALSAAFDQSTSPPSGPVQ